MRENVGQSVDFASSLRESRADESFRWQCGLGKLIVRWWVIPDRSPAFNSTKFISSADLWTNLFASAFLVISVDVSRLM